MPERHPPSSTLISTGYIAADLDCSRAHIYNLAASDETFPRPVYVGTHRKFLRKEYEAFKRAYIAKNLGRAKRGRPRGRKNPQPEVAAE